MPKPSPRAYLPKRLAGLLGKAVYDWSMINADDRIAVGLSGGKDSLVMLKLLAERRKRLPITYHLHAIHIEMGFHTVNHQALRQFCQQLDIELTLVPTDFGPRAHSSENREKSPCFFCALHRRRELFQITHELNCSKLALAHHQDDLIETFIMNLLYAGNLSTMQPVQPFFSGKLMVIRPLCLINAEQTRCLAQMMELPIQPPCCPSAAEGQRSQARLWLEKLYAQNRKIRPSIWRAITAAGLAHTPNIPKRLRDDYIN